MISFFANLFGYLLNFLYNLLQNYGLSIILFTVIVKIVLLPISISQQKTMKKTAKVQEEIKKLQVKYKTNPEELQRETMELYKREKVNPFGGCLSAIVQIILVLSVFYLVRSPLTYMKQLNKVEYNQSQSEGENAEGQKISVIEHYLSELDKSGEKSAYPEIQIIEKYASEDERVQINMEFLGLNLSSIPSKDISDWKTYVIPVLYVISTFISMRITTNMQKKNKKEVIEVQAEGEKDKDKEEDVNVNDIMNQTNRNMSYMMPILAVSISLVAPLGLALYWLVNNIIMTTERLILNAIFKDKEEGQNA